MNTSRLFLALLLSVSAACNRPSPSPEDIAAEKKKNEQRLLDDRRIAELKELEQRVADREQALVDSKNAADRQAIQAERADLEKQRGRLNDAQERIQQRQAAQDQDERHDQELRNAEDRALARRSQAEAAKTAQKIEKLEQKLDLFHDALAPDGAWLEVDRYGYVWQPYEGQDIAWRPYTNGSWIWTNYGWTWDSHEKFGWATYHYGRWARLKHLGWVWVPGSEWAPAWVAWRHNDNFVGWAPLPPSAYSNVGFNSGVDSYYDIGPGNYSFIAVQNFGDPTYLGSLLGVDRNLVIINNTVNVTNIVYRKIDSRPALFNGGPEFSKINLNSRKQVRELRVEKVDRPGLLTAQAPGVLQLAAPLIASASKALVAPATVKKGQQLAEIDGGWAGVTDAATAQQLRGKFTKEAQAAELTQRSMPMVTASPKIKSPEALSPAGESMPAQPSGLRRPLAQATPKPPVPVLREVASPVVTGDVAPAEKPELVPPANPPAVVAATPKSKPPGGTPPRAELTPLTAQPPVVHRPKATPKPTVPAPSEVAAPGSGVAPTERPSARATLSPVGIQNEQPVKSPLPRQGSPEVLPPSSQRNIREAPRVSPQSMPVARPQVPVQNPSVMPRQSPATSGAGAPATKGQKLPINGTVTTPVQP